MADTTPPVVEITSPADNSTVRGTITLTATASDDMATPPVVKFYMGSTLIGTGARSGSTYTLSNIATTQVENGAYVLRAVATDGEGNTATAENTVIVDNSSAPIATPPGLYFGGKGLVLPPNVDRIYYGLDRLLGSSPTLPPPTGGGGGVVTPPPTGAPTRVASYRPNGTHYPSRTPWVGAPNSAFASSEEVECTWPAIAAAITRATNAYPNGDCRILVRPGTLPGNGSGSTSTPVLQNLGALGRKSRIVVAPRDGVFSVQHEAGIRIHNVKGVTFLGFSIAGEDHVEANGGTDQIEAGKTEPTQNTSPNALSWRGLVVTDVKDFAFGWAKVTHCNITAAAGGASIDGLELVELVAPDNVISNSDRMGLRNLNGSSMRDVALIGLWMAPRWRNDGSAHLDTLQTSGNSVRFDAFTFLDCFLNGPSNAVLIMAGDGVEQYNATIRPFIDHCALIGGTRASNAIYPFITGPLPTTPTPQKPVVAFGGGPVCLNGQPWEPSIRDSLLSGQVVWKFKSMENTKYAGSSGPAPGSGAPIIESGLFGSLSSFQSYGIERVPTIADMKSWWAY